MGGKTLTRVDLAEAVYRKVGLSTTESADLVETVLDAICDSVVAGDSVKLSSFGSFLVREKKERVGRNPKTGIEVIWNHMLRYRAEIASRTVAQAAPTRRASASASLIVRVAGSGALRLPRRDRQE